MNDKETIYTNVGNIIPKRVTNITLSPHSTNKPSNVPHSANKLADISHTTHDDTKNRHITHNTANLSATQQRKPVQRPTSHQSRSTYEQIIFNQVPPTERARLQKKAVTHNQTTRVSQSQHIQPTSVNQPIHNQSSSSLKTEPQLSPDTQQSHKSSHKTPHKSKPRHQNKSFLSYIKDYDGSNLLIPYIYDSLLKSLTPYGLSAILEIIVTVSLIAILIYPFHLNATNTDFDFKAPNALLLQEAPAHPDALFTYNYSGTYLPQSLVETEPIISGILDYKNKQTIVIKIDNPSNWQEVAAKKIEAIIHAIIDNRTPELFNVEGKNLVFCVQVKDVTHYSCYLPYDAIRGYTKDNSQDVLFTKQLKYYGRTV